MNEQLKEIAWEAWKSAANAHRLYPDNKHTFSDYWEAMGKQTAERLSTPLSDQGDVWTRVEDGLPDDGDIVFVSFINTAKEICQCAAWFQKVTRHCGEDSPKDNRWFVYPSSGHEIRPTHWRSKPTPPKEELK